jgi:hypothetical protein
MPLREDIPCRTTPSRLAVGAIEIYGCLVAACAYPMWWFAACALFLERGAGRTACVEWSWPMTRIAPQSERQKMAAGPIVEE